MVFELRASQLQATFNENIEENTWYLYSIIWGKIENHLKQVDISSKDVTGLIPMQR